MSILGKYKRWNPLIVLNNKNVWDFCITQSTNTCNNIYDKHCVNTKLSAYIDFGDKECINDNVIMSKKEYVWSGATSYDAVLNSIGLTGVDNGLISFNHDKISDVEYYDILTNSKWNSEDGGVSLKLHPINSNSGLYDTSYTIDNNGFITLKGGFLQGFFKEESINYQVLPHEIEDVIHYEIVLRPRDYVLSNKCYNKINPNNSGIIFYIGTRSENKFVEEYGKNLDEYEVREIGSERNDMCDEFYSSNYTNISKEPCGDYFLEDEYLSHDENIMDMTVTDKNDNPLNTEGYYEIKTDNKYLFFNNTEEGFNVDTWDDENEILLTGITQSNRDNLYLLLNNTKDGYNVDTINEYWESHKDTNPHFNRDICENALCIRINEDGAIGYRYLISDCDDASKMKMIEEYGKPNVISTNEWYTINIQLERLNGKEMIIKIYVNGRLKFISKNIPLLNLRQLNESAWKQEGVPYNISVGGGTMGLSNSIIKDYFKPFKYVTPLEKYFAGSFIGDIKSFKIYTSHMQHSEIEGSHKCNFSLLPN